MKLYVHPLSGHSHRAQLFLSLAGISHGLVAVDMGKGEHKSASFLALNRFGQVPVLVDGAVVVPDSIAIMVYAVKRFGKTDWLPEEPAAAAAAVQRWLSVAAGPIAFGLNQARLITVFKAPLDAATVVARSHAVLALIDAELADRMWIAAAHPTIADVALYSYVSAAPEGNVDLADYAHVRNWLARVEALPGFIPFQKTAAGLRA